MQEMQETRVQYLGQEEPQAGTGNALQYSCLENFIDRGAWWATVHRVAKSWTWLSNWSHPYRTRKGWNKWTVPSLTIFRRERLPTLVLPGELHGLCSPWGRRVRHDWANFTGKICSFFPLLLKFLLKGNVSPRVHAWSVVYDSLEPHEL